MDLTNSDERPSVASRCTGSVGPQSAMTLELHPLKLLLLSCSDIIMVNCTMPMQVGEGREVEEATTPSMRHSRSGSFRFRAGSKGLQFPQVRSFFLTRSDLLGAQSPFLSCSESSSSLYVGGTGASLLENGIYLRVATQTCWPR